MKTLPRTPFEVIEAELLFQLLMGLLANPSGFDGGGQCAQICRRGQISKIVFLLPRGALLANEPRFLAWEMLLTLIPYSLRRPVGDAHTDSSKSGFQPTLRNPTQGGQDSDGRRTAFR